MGHHVSRRFRSIAPIAACMQATAQQIAWGAIGRRAIRLDPRWRGGDYYDAEPGDGPAEGLAIARQIAQVTFRSDNVFTDRFGRDLADRPAFGDTFGLWQQFEVERYLEYHGERLVHRFDANSYLVIGKAMDLHDIARSRVRSRRDGAHHRPVAGDRDLERHALPGVPAAPSTSCSRCRGLRARTPRSTHHMVTTRS